MKHLRSYGNPPYRTAVIHGGPGAAGEMSPVAQELASRGMGVLEPLQTAASLDGQVLELSSVLEAKGDVPVTLIGFSWGAWLSLLVAARFPALVKRLILIGCGGLEEQHGIAAFETRMERFTEADAAALQSLQEKLDAEDSGNKDQIFARMGALFEKVDAYDPLDCESDPGMYRYDIYRNVWNEALELRKNGKLLELVKRVRCPVTAIHGDYDPHPAEGVREPLCRLLRDFQFILLRNCGHKPWCEKQARDAFYAVLKEVLSPKSQS